MGPQNGTLRAGSAVARGRRCLDAHQNGLRAITPAHRMASALARRSAQASLHRAPPRFRQTENHRLRSRVRPHPLTKTRTRRRGDFPHRSARSSLRPSARIEIIYLEPPLENISEQNRNRPDPVPTSVINHLTEKLEPP